MSTPYPSQPRRLMRDPSRKLIGGVCSGVAKYLNMDVNLVRILTVLISLFTGVPIVLYIIALFVLPEERSEPPQPPYVTGPPAGAYDAGFAGQAYQQPTYGAPAQPAPDPVWGAGGAPWEQPQTAAPAPQTWQQPPAGAPATAAPEQAPAGAPVPETVVPETVAYDLPADQTSTWESAPADPSSAESAPSPDSAGPGDPAEPEDKKG